MKALKIIMIVFCPFVIQSIYAQTDKSYILKNTNITGLERLAIEASAEYEIEHNKGIEKAQRLGWPTLNLVRLDKDGDPMYIKPYNNDASSFTQTLFTRSFFGVTGAGMTVGMWEATEGSTSSYRPRHTHQDFGARITQQDGGSGFSSHASHVAGTLIGQPPNGVSVNSTGMAPQASLSAYGSANDISEMSTAAANGLLVSNHSYGPITGYEFEEHAGEFPFNWKKWTWYGGTNQFNQNGDDPEFGAYSGGSTWGALGVDRVCFLSPYYLPVISAGNDHNNNPFAGVFVIDEVRDGSGGAYMQYSTSIHPTGDGNQACTIAGKQCATNILTIGNMTKSLGINESSSRGAMDDGRIKPDLCGIGTDLYSAVETANDAYGNKTGTSMSAPNVAGSLLLLQEVYEDYHGSGQFMLSSTLKGLALHTATDQGNPGPDYTYGWGLMNTFIAGAFVAQDAWRATGGTSTATLIEASLDSPSDTYIYTFNASGTEDIKVTMVYTDPVSLISTTTALQNDLDLFLIDNSIPAGFEPYKLDVNNPNNIATTGDNDVDNVEQIYLPNAITEAGLYTINVSLENTVLFNGTPQNFSLIISGINPSCHYDIHHKTVHLLTATYSAQNDIFSEADIEPGNAVNYQYGGKVVLKPGFHAKENGYFKTTAGSCN